jgi:hypothetical protein
MQTYDTVCFDLPHRLGTTESSWKAKSCVLHSMMEEGKKGWSGDHSCFSCKVMNNKISSNASLYYCFLPEATAQQRERCRREEYWVKSQVK